MKCRKHSKSFACLLSTLLTISLLINPFLTVAAKSTNTSAVPYTPHVTNEVREIPKSTPTKFNPARLSENVGNNIWNSIGPNGGIILSMTIDPVTPSTIYVGTNAGAFKSTDGGQNWSPINTGLNSPSIYAFAVDPIVRTTVYAGTGMSGVFKSTNSGANWSAVNIGLANTEVFALAIDPTNSSTVVDP